jgi:hypothetical protein
MKQESALCFINGVRDNCVSQQIPALCAAPPPALAEAHFALESCAGSDAWAAHLQNSLNDLWG